MGIAEAEGLLKLTDPVLSFFPEYAAVASEGTERIQIRDLLHMSTGHSEEKYRLKSNADRAKLFFETPMVHQVGFIHRMQTDLVPTLGKDDPETRAGYGYQVWNCTIPNTYRADGMYGQMCVVLKDYNAVITVTAHNETNHKDILRAIWSEILPKL